MKHTERVRRICAIGLLIASCVCGGLVSQASAQLTSGATLNFEATLDTDGDSTWESTTANQTRNWALGATVSRDTSPTGNPAGITAAYNFPTSGSNAGTDKGTAGSWNTFTETQDASWELWLQADDLATNQSVWEAGGNGNGVSINVTSSGDIMFVVKHGVNSDAVTAAFPADGNFHQIVAVYERDNPASIANPGTGDTISLYIDKTLVAGGPGAGDGDEETSMENWVGGDGAGIGGISGGGGPQHGGSDGDFGALGYGTLDGQIGLLRFYDSTALTLAQITANYDAVTATDVFFDDDSADGLWATDANWDTNIQPTSGQNAFINGGLSADVTLAGEVADNLTVGSNSTGGPNTPGTGTLNVQSGSLTVGTDLRVGEGGVANVGTVDQTGGTVSVGNDLLFGATGGTENLYDLDGGTLSVSGDVVHTGGATRGHLYVDDPGSPLSVTGNITIQSFRVGDDEAGDQTLSGGTDLTTTGTLLVGRVADGDLTLDGGTHVADNMTVSDAAGAAGSSLTLSSGASLSVTSGATTGLDVGDATGSDGTININGGSTLTAAGRVDLGQVGTANGTINVNDGLLDINGGGLFIAGDDTGDGSTTGSLTVGASGVVDVNGGNTEVGRGGTGTFTLDGGDFNQNTNNFVIAQTGGSATGIATINSGTLDITNDLNMNGGTGGATLTINGGTVTIGDNLAMATNVAGTSTVNLNGGTLNVTNPITDGAGTSTINFEGTAGIGSTDITADFFNINPTDPGGTVTYTRTGGTLAVNNELTLGGETSGGGNHKGNLTQNGGTVTVGGDLLFGGVAAGNNEGGTYDLNAGTLTVSGDIIEGASGSPNASIDTAQLYVDDPGALTVTGDIIVQSFRTGDDQNGSHTVNAGQTVTTTGTLLVGRAAVGTLTLESTGNVAANMTVGDANGSAGSVLTLQNASTLTVNGAIDVADANNSGGTIDILAGSTLTQTAGQFDIGQAGNASGTVNVTDGLLDINTGGLYIAGNGGTGGTGDSGTTGVVTVGASGQIDVNGGNTEVGRGGTGTLTIDGGDFNQNTNNLVLAQTGGSSMGTVTINSGTLDVGDGIGSDSDLNMNGGTGGAFFNHNGGDVFVERDIQMATANAGSASYIMNTATGTLTVGRDLEVGEDGPAVFTQTDGDVDVTRNVVLGTNATSSGTYNMNGGTLDAVDLNFGAGSPTVFNQNGGVVTLTGDVNDGAGTSTINLNDGTMDVTGNVGSGGAPINSLTVGDGDATAATLEVDGDVTVVTLNGGSDGTILHGAAGTTTVTADNGNYGGVLDDGTGTLELTKESTGTLTLSGPDPNTYSGTTTVNAGTLILDKDATGTTAVSGPLVIGDGGGTDIVRLAESQQIDDGSTITINSSGTLDLDGNDETIGPLTLSSGTIDGMSGTDTLTLTAAVSSSGASTIGGSNDTLDINNGGGGGTFSVTGGTLTVDRNIISAADVLTKTGGGTLNIDGGATLSSIINNAGTVNLQSDVTLSGATGIDNNATMNITAGTTDLQGNDIDSTGGTFTLAGSPGLTGPTLQDVNEFMGTLNQTGGLLRAGQPTEATTMTITDDYIQGVNGWIEVDIYPTEVDPVHDVYDVANMVELSGVLKIVTQDGFNPGPSKTPPVVGFFADVIIANAIMVNPSFMLNDDWAPLTGPPFRTWDFIVVDLPGGGQALRLIVTPEPASVLVWLLMAGIGGVFYWRRRRK